MTTTTLRDLVRQWKELYGQGLHVIELAARVTIAQQIASDHVLRITGIKVPSEHILAVLDVSDAETQPKVKVRTSRLRHSFIASRGASPIECLTCGAQNVDPEHACAPTPEAP